MAFTPRVGAQVLPLDLELAKTFIQAAQETNDTLIGGSKHKVCELAHPAAQVQNRASRPSGWKIVHANWLILHCARHRIDSILKLRMFSVWVG
jgi:hypothetical protein